jgi:hypothetical protein
MSEFAEFKCRLLFLNELHFKSKLGLDVHCNQANIPAAIWAFISEVLASNLS